MRRELVCSVVVAVAFGLAVIIFAPLRTAYQIGGDEGFELMKALLCSKGIALYTQIWNDQPPLHTALLAALFRLFGPSAFCGRVLTVALASALLLSLLRLVGRREGIFPALAAGLILLASPQFLNLSMSAMVEIPAFALALFSARSAVLWTETRRTFWLCLSGILMGLAIMTKLTAALLAPGLIIEIISARRTASCFLAIRPALKKLALWAGTVLAVALCTTLLYSGMTFDQLLGTHLAGSLREITRNNPGVNFSLGMLWLHFDCLLPAAVAVLMRTTDGRFSTIRLPVVWFVTALLAHEFNRPYWAFYYLHFAIPLSWLAAVGYEDILARALTEFKAVPSCLLARPAAWLAIFAALCAVSSLEGGWRLALNWASIHEEKSVADHQLVRIMRAYRSHTHWVYTTELLCPFYAGLKVPPELAVVSFKRVMSGRITSSDILAYLREYRPEQLLLLSYGKYDADWNAFLRGYVTVGSDGDFVLLVSEAMTRSDKNGTLHSSAAK